MMMQRQEKMQENGLSNGCVTGERTSNFLCITECESQSFRNSNAKLFSDNKSEFNALSKELLLQSGKNGKYRWKCTQNGTFGPFVTLCQSCLELAIQSLDSLNDQIVQYIFAPKACEFDVDADDDCMQPKQREALKSSMALMRRLLMDAQAKFRKMVEDNKQLATRIDGDIQSAQEEVSILRAELADTNRRINELTPSPTDTTAILLDSVDNAGMDLQRVCHDKCQGCPRHSENQVQDELSKLRVENEKLGQQNRSLQREVEELRTIKERVGTEENEFRPKLQKMETELQHAKDALGALKADRKRLKAEKFDLLNEMKQLYGTLEDKEKELRDFIRNYEQRMKDSDCNLQQARRQLNQLGYYSDHESQNGKVNGYHTPSLTTPNGRDSAMGNSSSIFTSTPTPLDNIPGPAADVDNCSIYSSTLGTIRNDTDSSSMLNIHQPGLSRSAEELSHVLSNLDLKKKGTYRRNNSKGTWGSISKVFSRSKSRRSMDPAMAESFDKRASWSPHNSLCASPLTEETYSEKIKLLEEAQTIHIESWKAATVLAWLEVTMGMPQYGSLCAENIKSGKVLLELNDSELDAGLGITNPMHRRKLRLAIEELRDPNHCKYLKISELSHIWVCNEWLPSLGLGQYVDTFALHLIDARMLDYLSKKDLERFLGVTRKFHQVSIMHGIQFLRMVGFDRQLLIERRSMCEQTDGDPLVWTNQRFIQWAHSIDLGEYAENLKDSGVHGALVVLEPSFTADTMATALGIPQSKNIIRRHLMTELESIVHPARVLLEQEYFNNRQLTKKEKHAMGSLGRSFSHSYAGGLPGSKPDGRRSSLRGSLTRALGLKMKQDLQNSSQYCAATAACAFPPSSASSILNQSPLLLSSQHSPCQPHHHNHHYHSHHLPPTPRPPPSSTAAYSHHHHSRTCPSPHALSSSSSSSSATVAASATTTCGPPAAGILSARSTPTPTNKTVMVETHRRVKSSGDIETITVTPV